MKKTRISESQIVSAIKQHESGKSTADICRELGVHQATFYNWKKKYSGMDSQELRRMKDLEEENRRLKQMYADLALDHKILKDVLSKKFKSPASAKTWLLM
jgi:putative transposase